MKTVEDMPRYHPSDILKRKGCFCHTSANKPCAAHTEFFKHGRPFSHNDCPFLPGGPKDLYKNIEEVDDMTNATTEKALEVSAKVLHWLKTATKEEIEDKMAEFDGFYSFNIAKEFTNTPGGRLREHGKFSGEELRDDFILPLVLRARSKGMTLRIILDGGYGYAASFLEEVFGGMARKIGSSVVRETISLITEEQPELHSEILNFINNCQLENDCEVATEEVSVVFLVVRKCQSNFQITNVIGVFHNSTLAHECVDRMHELDEQYEDDFDNHLYNNGYIGSYEVLTIEVITSKAQFEEALDFQAEEK